MTISAAVVSALLLLLVMVATLLWLLVPVHVANVVCAYSPWLPPAYHACRGAGIVSLAINERFAANRRDKSALMTLVAEKLSEEDHDTRRFAAEFASGVLWGERNTGNTVDCDPLVQARVITQTAPLLHSGDAEVQLSALSVLCLLQAKEHLPQMLVTGAALPITLRGYANLALGMIDDSQVTSWLLAEFARDPSIDLLGGLGGQSDARALTAIHSVLQAPGHHNHSLILYVLIRWPPNDAVGLAEVAKLANHSLKDVRESALHVLDSTAGLPHMLNLRRDPGQRLLHPAIDQILIHRAPSLTADEQQQWHAAQQTLPTTPTSP